MIQVQVRTAPPLALQQGIYDKDTSHGSTAIQRKKSLRANAEHVVTVNFTGEIHETVSGSRQSLGLRGGLRNRISILRSSK